MRTSNEKVKNVIISVYFILIVLAVLWLTIFRAFNEIDNNPVVAFFVIALVFILLFIAVHFISKYFEYDSDGLKVTVTNKGLLLSDYLNYREHTIEFEKTRLSGFKINNYFIYKELVLFIVSKNGHHIKKERFNITLVAKKKRKYMKQSLRKMVKQNRKEQS
ncbi:hypothetical protein SAMN04487989_102406 [Bizionia echini]|uniref:Uncharacterized protein n=1 Tax=Bizionia echini TaxID=649333 RepID=A0A1I5B0P8_9FLAO|nr:hypothetical protein [Bizionia echini]SFN68200.1 hypothetical protein SAMN04487989_102406 [Bizionia echini]|tara:strand:+ start:137 stop:622 length:486 start_codon:yes stop_codon:yes gene_type:complete